MLLRFVQTLNVVRVAVMLAGLQSQIVSAADSQSTATTAKPEILPQNINQSSLHRRILDRPAVPPEGTSCELAYELGSCHQLDRDHCLLVASMDEQGGGDLCVGNDGFIIQKLVDVAAE